MSVWTSIWTGISWTFTQLISLFVAWLSIFAAPFRHLEMLWIIVPIYLSWMVTDFFQERKGTSIGNAIANGVVVFWVSFDWMRTVIGSMAGFSWTLVVKFVLIGLVFMYSLMILIEGMRGNNIVTKLGRVRETTYVLLMFTPIIYNEIELSWKVIIAILLFFPLFYFLMEYVNARILPQWKVIAKVEKADTEIEQTRKLFG